MKPEEFQSELDKNAAESQSQENNQAQIKAITKAGIKNVEATNTNTRSTASALKDIRGKVEVTNSDLAKTEDVASAVDAINKMNLTAFVASQDKYTQMAQNMLDLAQELKSVAESIQGNGKTLDSTLSGSIDKITAISDKLSSINITSNKNIETVLNNVLKAVQAIDVKPQVTVDSPTVTVPQPRVTVTGKEVDLSPLSNLLEEIKTAVSKDSKEPDFTEVTQAVNNVQSAINNLTFPVANYVLPFKDVNGKAVQVQLDASGNIPTVGGSTLPTTVLSGKTTVTTAGTRTVLASSTPCQSVTVKALAANVGLIYVGNTAVSSTNGHQLSASDSISMDIANLNTINIDSSVSGEGVTYLGVN